MTATLEHPPAPSIENNPDADATVAPDTGAVSEGRSSFLKGYKQAWDNSLEYYFGNQPDKSPKGGTYRYWTPVKTQRPNYSQQGKLGEVRETLANTMDKLRGVPGIKFLGEKAVNGYMRVIGEGPIYESHRLVGKTAKFAGKAVMGTVGLPPYIAKVGFDKTQVGHSFNTSRHNTYRRRRDKAAEQDKQRRAAKFQKKMDRKQKAISRGRQR